MEQKIRDKVRLSQCFCINEQFLVSLDKIIYAHDEQAEMKIKITCGGITYSFDGSAEFITFAETMTEVIGDMQIRIKFLNKSRNLWSNEINFEFYNNPESLSLHPGDITFDFDDKRDFLVLKNEIQTLLKNYELGTAYSFVSTVPILVYATILVATAVIVFGGSKGWNMPSLTMAVVAFSFAWIVELIFGKLPKKIKRYIFPFIEFEFGNNKRRNEKGRTIRRFVGGAIIVAFLVSLLAGYVGDIIF